MRTTEDKSGLRGRSSVLLALNAAVIAGVLAAIAAVPTGNRLVVIAPPWSDPGKVFEIVAKAGGSLVNSAAQDWIVIAEAEERGFAGRLIAAGAMLVLDGRLGEACLKFKSNP